jgi:hypothetical protein
MNPNASDAAQRTAEQAPADSIDFKRMIHRIHTGEELSEDYTIIGSNGSVNNFNEIRFPGDRRDCTTCHLEDTQQVLATLPPGRLPTETLRDWYTPQQPTAAACLGCHDSERRRACVRQHGPLRRSLRGCHGPNAGSRSTRLTAISAVVGPRRVWRSEGVKSRVGLAGVAWLAGLVLVPVLLAQAPAPTPTPKPPAPATTPSAAAEVPKCADCHEAQVKGFGSNPHARTHGTKAADPEEACSTCSRETERAHRE